MSEDFWTRKSKVWEAELEAIETERLRIDTPRESITVTAQKILELAKQAEILYKSQDPAEQRRVLEAVLSNCTFDRGTLSPTYNKPFDLFVQGNKTGDWLLRLDSYEVVVVKPLVIVLGHRHTFAEPPSRPLTG